MKKNIFIIAILAFSLNTNAQKYFTKEGEISFYSKAPLEDIEAHNSKATAVMDLESGKMEWAILIKAFQFEKALMQEHFNENYMESSKYPKALFKGSFLNWKTFDTSKDQELLITINGILSIRGKEKEISAPVTLQVKDGKLSGSSTFKVLVEDFDINIPGVVKDNIAKEVEIKVNCQLNPIKS
jgi:hypothetical protein